MLKVVGEYSSFFVCVCIRSFGQQLSSQLFSDHGIVGFQRILRMLANLSTPLLRVGWNLHRFANPLQTFKKLPLCWLQLSSPKRKWPLGMGTFFFETRIVRHSKKFFRQKAKETPFEILSCSKEIVGKQLLLFTGWGCSRIWEFRCELRGAGPH